jgi:hypothetical protein
MENFIKKLPLDIILQIIPYTYNFQNKKLLFDIKNYKETNTLLLELYRKIWIIDFQSPNPQEDKDWLINDIISYANNYNATMYGYIDQFYNIFKRNIFLKLNEDVDNYLNYLEEKEVSSQINIVLGLLTINERNEFLSHVQNELITVI